jgi:transcriptional regulator with XRE-family HTH domain/ADP-ribosylglycohydrolase
MTNMDLGLSISKLRTDANLTQEKFAQILNVSRQTVQKWEYGEALPDINNIIKIAKFFNISLDALVLRSDGRIVEELAYDKKMQPAYEKIHDWESYSSQLPCEYRESVEEGKDIEKYSDLITAVSKMPASKHKEQIAGVLFDIIINSPQKEGYEYNEPSDLEHIKLLRPEFKYEAQKTLSPAELESKITGAWLGRISGCLLGKPIEGIKTGDLHPILKESGNFPMHRYIRSTDITAEMCERSSFRLKDRCYADTITFSPVDDDTNYTVLAQVLVEKYGLDFTAYDVSRVWTDYQPKLAYCTAERVAFRNFIYGYVPPYSAIYKNPYREFIGAQIRADYYGYINPGNPELAAEMAWRDASVSHTKNGIYGEMFVAAMIAYAAVNDSIEDVIMGGLAQIPATSRLYEAITKVLEDYKNGVSEHECFTKIHRQYDENDPYDWCHTIPNAVIVTAALLYGKGDFTKSICLAVQACFDTDCNGATVGSIVGIMKGAENINEEWTSPFNGELETSVFGMSKVKVKDLVATTLKHIEKGSQKA